MARRDDWAGKPYAEMRAKMRLMTQLQLPDPMSMMEARRWVLAGGTSDQVPPNDLVYDFARQMLGNFQVIDRSFSVAWQGQLTVPQSGDYTFFISPIDVGAGFSNPPVNVSMTVLVAGQAIITAAPPTPPTQLPLPTPPPVQPAPTSNWVSHSNPVTLTAGTPVSLQIAFSAHAPQKISMGAIHATLSWQGPGISTSLVPASAFSQAQTGAPGLQATYTWTARGQQQTLTRVDPMIDFSWTNSSLLLAQDPTSANQSADAMWQAMTAAAFISSYANPTSTFQIHPFLREPENASCGLSTARRQAFLDLLTQNPTLLDAMDPGLAVDFFQAFRVGTPDTALNVFGTWAARQADLACALTADRFFDRNSRVSLAGMAMLTTQQLPAQITRLQQEFLQVPDGRCSLPVAYNRLLTSQVGSLSGTTISGTPASEEDWTLDGLGNWAGYVQKTTGTATLNQSRTASPANGISAISASVGSTWATPAYDLAGNMTTIPIPPSPTSGYTATYDAWNRLISLANGSTAVATYAYDGLSRRMLKAIYVSGTLDHKEHAYFNDDWQLLEVRKEVSGTVNSNPLEQYVWQAFYIDAPALRDYDPATSGSPTRYYYTFDANLNATATTTAAGAPTERYYYSPYGSLLFLDATFNLLATQQSQLGNSVTFTGRQFDAESGLYHYRYRYYHSNIGTFVSRDPVTYIGGLNLYAGSFAVNGIDPLGLATRRYRCFDMLIQEGSSPTKPIGIITVSTGTTGAQNGQTKVKVSFKWEALTNEPMQNPYMGTGSGASMCLHTKCVPIIWTAPPGGGLKGGTLTGGIDVGTIGANGQSSGANEDPNKPSTFNMVKIASLKVEPAKAGDTVEEAQSSINVHTYFVINWNVSLKNGKPVQDTIEVLPYPPQVRQGTWPRGSKILEEIPTGAPAAP
jgi:RHS repeat-associated protein